MRDVIYVHIVSICHKRPPHRNAFHVTQFDDDNPLYKMVDGVGTSEVVVESPVHNQLIGIATNEQVVHTLRAIVARGLSVPSLSEE